MYILHSPYVSYYLYIVMDIFMGLTNFFGFLGYGAIMYHCSMMPNAKHPIYLIDFYAISFAYL